MRQLRRRALVATVLVQCAATGLRSGHVHCVAEPVEHKYSRIDCLDIGESRDATKE
jgi:hypothetical protein